MTVSTKEYARLALQIAATDRGLARAIVSASTKLRPPRRELVLLEAALRDALAETTVSREDADANRLIRQAGERPSEAAMRLADNETAKPRRRRRP